MFSGLWPPDWSPEYDCVKENIPWPESPTGYIRIQRKDFSDYITEELLSYLQMWHRIKQYGWPQNRGYLAEPETVRLVVELFDAEKETFLAWKEKNNGK